MENSIALSWELFSIGMALFVAWCGFLVGVIKWLIDRAIKSTDNRFATIEKDIGKERERRIALEKEFHDHLAELPLMYVQREDWIRLATTIDTKMDRLVSKIDEVKDRLYARS